MKDDLEEAAIVTNVFFNQLLLSNSGGVSIAGLFYFDFLIVVRAVLRSVVRPGVGSVPVRAVGLGLLLLVVDWHQVLHVHGVLSLLVGPDADRGEAEQDRGDESKSHANPGDDVGPLVLELRVLLQDLWPGLGEELCVAGGADLIPLPVLHPVPQTHSSSTEQTGNEHEDGGGGDV